MRDIRNILYLLQLFYKLKIQNIKIFLRLQFYTERLGETHKHRLGGDEGTWTSGGKANMKMGMCPKCLKSSSEFRVAQAPLITEEKFYHLGICVCKP